MATASEGMDVKDEMERAEADESQEDRTLLITETLLAEIFRRLPFEERLQTVPLVCRGWRSATQDPACWRDVDMSEWFRKRTDEANMFMWEYEYRCEEEMEFYIKKVVDNSCGQLRELRTTHCTDAAVEYVAERCPHLEVLAMPDSLYATDMALVKLAERCRKLRALDLSDCYGVGSEALEAFGRHCEGVEWLARNMVRLNDFLSQGPASHGDVEAAVIGQHFVNLKHLELKKSSISDAGLAHVAKGCPKLEGLNLACCSVSPYALEQVPRLCPELNRSRFVKPIVPRMHVNPKYLMVLFD